MEDQCPTCAHEFAPHLFLALDEPHNGGVVLCPVKECLCYSTWGINGAAPQRVPDDVELAALRADLQDVD